LKRKSADDCECKYRNILFVKKRVNVLKRLKILVRGVICNNLFKIARKKSHVIVCFPVTFNTTARYLVIEISEKCNFRVQKVKNIKLNAMKNKNIRSKKSLRDICICIEFLFLFKFNNWAQNSISYKKDHDVVSYFLLGLLRLNTVETAFKNLHFLNSGKNSSCVFG